jgi:hypothetical protein
MQQRVQCTECVRVSALQFGLEVVCVCVRALLCVRYPNATGSNEQHDCVRYNVRSQQSAYSTY